MPSAPSGGTVVMSCLRTPWTLDKFFSHAHARPISAPTHGQVVWAVLVFVSFICWCPEMLVAKGEGRAPPPLQTPVPPPPVQVQVPCLAPTNGADRRGTADISALAGPQAQARANIVVESATTRGGSCKGAHQCSGFFVEWIRLHLELQFLVVFWRAAKGCVAECGVDVPPRPQEGWPLNSTRVSKGRGPDFLHCHWPTEAVHLTTRHGRAVSLRHPRFTTPSV